MVRHKSVDVNLQDNGGVTALHYCADLDHDTCAKALLEHGAKMCIKSNVGFFPMHLAAQNGSRKTLEILLQKAESAGYKRADLLAYTDASQNMPLHAATLSGDLEAVRTCLMAGAQIDAVQTDQQTPVHLACTQGSLDIVKLMFECQPEKTGAILTSKDLAEMTPLHSASVFDRLNVVEYLVEQGADMNEPDAMERSPLLLAAEKKAWNTVRYMLKTGADITLRDKFGSNIMHLIIRNGGRPEQFRDVFCMCKKSAKELLNESDECGFTALHYASKEGMVSTINQLLAMGASLTAKTKTRESPIHFAAKYGRYNTCLRLLDGHADTGIINEANEGGFTPLILAAANGHTRVVELLLHRGAAAVTRNHEGDTCLHVAAENGYTKTMSIIHSVHSSLIDAQNKYGNTPLHTAAVNGCARAVTLLLSLGAKFLKNNEGHSLMDVAIKNDQKDVCAAVVSHNRWREALSICSPLYGCPVIGLIAHVPDVCQMVLDRSKSSSPDDPKSPNFHYVYDFHFLQLSMEKVRKLREAGQEYLPLFALNKMVNSGRVNCLSHPVCTEYLRMKWRAYGLWFYMVNIAIYLTFLISLTVFVGSYPSTVHDDYPHTRLDTNVSGNSSADPGVHLKFKLDPNHRILVIIIMAFCLLNALKEIFQMFQQKAKYFLDVNNGLEWILYVSSAIFMSPFIMDMSTHFQWQCGAIAVFLAWFNLLLFLQRLDFFGIYVVMFLQILKTLLQVLVVFFVLIVAFGLSFYIIMAGKGSIAYQSPAISLVTTGVMMLGSIDYLDSWVLPYADGDPATLHFSTLSFVILIVFILLMPILLMNLLIGLAVGDIEAVQRDAKLRRLAMQVELHTEIERKLPQRLLELVDRNTVKVYPHSGKFLFQKIWNKLQGSRGFHATEPEDDDGAFGTNQYIYEELHKQKHRMKQMAVNLDKQYDLLRLIVQKMEIQSEADDADEGDSTNQATTIAWGRHGIGWSSPAIRRTLLQQTSVLHKLTKS